MATLSLASRERASRVTGLKLIHISNDLAGRHYAEHEGKPFYEGLISFITSSPSVAMVLEGTNAVGNVRKMMGVTDPSESLPGTIRGDYGLDLGRNIVHGSANLDDAAREVSLFFDETEIASYDPRGRSLDLRVEPGRPLPATGRGRFQGPFPRAFPGRTSLARRG